MTPDGAPASSERGSVVLLDAESHRILAHVTGQAREGPPRPDVSKVASARVVAWIELESPVAHSLAGCVRAPSGRFAAGLEDVLFERATRLALSSLGTSPAELVVESARASDSAFEQVLLGHSARGSLRIQHVITFDGPDRDLVLCSLLCEGERCDDTSLSIEGDPPAMPAASAWVRGMMWSADNPQVALAALAAAVMLITAWILWRRPYPQPT